MSGIICFIGAKYYFTLLSWSGLQ